MTANDRAFSPTEGQRPVIIPAWGDAPCFRVGRIPKRQRRDSCSWGWVRREGSSLFPVEWFSEEFLALEARMKVAGGKPGETRRTHRIAWQCFARPSGAHEMTAGTFVMRPAGARGVIGLTGGCASLRSRLPTGYLHWPRWGQGSHHRSSSIPPKTAKNRPCLANVIRQEKTSIIREQTAIVREQTSISNEGMRVGQERITHGTEQMRIGTEGTSIRRERMAWGLIIPAMRDRLESLSYDIVSLNSWSL